MTTFYIVRHGETDWNAQKLVQGHTDIPLNATGEAQAKALGEALRDIPFDLAFSSDLMRARKTAEIVLLEKQLAIETTEVLRERHYGALEGQHSSAFRTFDSLYRALSHEEKKTYKHDEHYESDEELTTRLITFLRETAITHPDKTILVGTHGGVLRTLLIHLGHATYDQHVKIANTAYFVLKTDGIEFTVTETQGVTLEEIHESE